MSTSLPPLPPLPALAPLVAPVLPPLPSDLAPVYSDAYSMEFTPWQPGWYDIAEYDPFSACLRWLKVRARWTGNSWQYDDQAYQPEAWRGLAAPPTV